jgi:hypothetical protein
MSRAADPTLGHAKAAPGDVEEMEVKEIWV